MTGAKDPSQKEKGGEDHVLAVTKEMAPADGKEDVERGMGLVKVLKERRRDQS